MAVPKSCEGWRAYRCRLAGGETVQGLRKDGQPRGQAAKVRGGWEAMRREVVGGPLAPMFEADGVEVTGRTLVELCDALEDAEITVAANRRVRAKQEASKRAQDARHRARENNYD